MAAIVRLRREYHVVAWSIVVIIFLYFVLPIAGATEFSLAETVTETGKQTYGLDAYRMIFDYPEFIDALKVTLRLTVISVALSLVIMVPTVTMVHLGAKRYRRLVEFVSIQPLVIPPVVLVLGVLNFMPTSWKGTPNLLGFEYAILSMPFTFRALDAGLMNLDVKTIVDAARGLGASWFTVLVRIVAPNLRTGIFGAVFLTIALVLGEFTMASLMLWNTFPTWIATVGQSNASLSVALSVASLAFAWVLLVLISLADRKKKA
jgi:putative spermidine/putrescine transport system permease protein